MIKLNQIKIIAVAAACFFYSGSSAQQKRIKVNNPLLLWDNKAAGEWMTEAYPLGNGSLGGMVFGGAEKERIQFNEISLWTGDETETGAYQAFGDLFIDFASASPVTGYRRELDLKRAVQTITYKQGNTNYKREYFCSFPDQLMVLKYSSATKGAYTAAVTLKDAHQAVVTAEGTRLNINGKLDNGLTYSAAVLIRAEGGTVSIDRDEKMGYVLNIKKANGFTVLLTAATDYLNERKAHWRGSPPAGKVNARLAAVKGKPDASLLSRHLGDYQQLFGRVSLELGATNDQSAVAEKQNQLPTFQRVLNYKKQPDPKIEELLFQYGRYLLISSSRKGGLPANLQGLWNESNNPPWRSDYHSNINIQMNYWLAEPTNLSECHFPYLDYINSMREVKKEHTSAQYPGVRGWTVKTENNIFGGESFTWNTPGSAWYVQDVWEHYAFTRDLNYLRNTGYGILKEVCEFWDDHLKRRDDGSLVAPLGWSPEHGPTEDGVSYDQQIIYDLFTNYIAAAKVLQKDSVYRLHIEDLRAHLLGPKIGKWGQLQEWETDRDDPKDNHRHASHLFALHPGKQINVLETPDLAKAAKVSLTARGDASTGWSMAWKMNFWARLQDGNHAYRILNNFITLVGGSGVDYNNGGGIYANLFCAHPPFQIDGNLGYTAGVTEMLMQSQTGKIQLLPALPDAWQQGKVSGIKARGNFEILEMTWKEGKIVKLKIRSLSGGKCSIVVPNRLKSATAAQAEVLNGTYGYDFSTVKGKNYEWLAE